MPAVDCNHNDVRDEYIDHKLVSLRRTLPFEYDTSNTQSSIVGEGGRWEGQQGQWSQDGRCG